MSNSQTEKSDEDEVVRERVHRLRTRLAKVRNPMDLVHILKGVLDLLEDEL